MNPEEIKRLADLERKRKNEEASRKNKKPFNPFDWMDFKKTRKWMAKNLALSDRIYASLLLLLMVSGLISWIYLENEEPWAYYAMIFLWPVFVAVVIIAFLYGIIKKRRNN